MSTNYEILLSLGFGVPRKIRFDLAKLGDREVKVAHFQEGSPLREKAFEDFYYESEDDVDRKPYYALNYDRKTEGFVSSRTRMPSIKYWKIAKFNEHLDAIINEIFNSDFGLRIIKNREFPQVRKFLDSVDDLDQESETFRVLEQIYLYTVESTLEFLRQTPEYRGSGTLNSIFNKVLQEIAYPLYILQPHSEIDVSQLLDLIAQMRKMWVQVDGYISNLILIKSGGVWGSIRMTDQGVVYRLEDRKRDGGPFADLFAGVGSFRKAFEVAGDFCEFTNDILAPSLITYEENFDIAEDEIVHKPIQEAKRTLEGKTLRGVLAGFPCKSFSKMGQLSRVSLGRASEILLDDPQFGQLIYEALEIVRESNAEYFVFENVPDFITSKMKLDDGTMVKLWEDIVLPTIVGPKSVLDNNYHVSYKILSSAAYSAQERERCFIVGIRKDLAPKFDFNKMVYAECDKDPKDYVLTFPRNCAHSILEMAEPPYTLPLPQHFEKFTRSLPNPKYNISSSKLNELRTKKRFDIQNPFKRLPFSHQVLPSNPNQKNETHAMGRKELLSSTLTGGIRNDMFTMYKCSITSEDVIRVITPRESARLMTFDADRTARMPFPVSDTNAYISCGYSIVTRLLEELSIAVIAHLDFHAKH